MPKKRMRFRDYTKLGLKLLYKYKACILQANAAFLRIAQIIRVFMHTERLVVPVQRPVVGAFCF